MPSVVGVLATGRHSVVESLWDTAVLGVVTHTMMVASRILYGKIPVTWDLCET